ncbi:hypothetical protein CR513_56572, partial [Mucuna pruriens]
MRSYRENDHVIRFLKGFNKQYSVVRSKIIFSLLIQHERQFNICYDKPKFASNVMDNKGRGKGSKGQNGGRAITMCSYHKRTSHIVDYCYKKHGFHPKFRKSNINYAFEEKK